MFYKILQNKKNWLLSFLLLSIFSNQSVCSQKDSDIYKARLVSSEISYPKWIIYSVGNQGWWDENWEYRVPVILYNDENVWLHNIPVNIPFDIQEKVDLNSIRIVNQVGDVIPHQISKGEKGYSILFLGDVPANSWRPYYIYLGNSKINVFEKKSMIEDRDNKGWVIKTGTLTAKMTKYGNYDGILYYLGNESLNFLHPAYLSLSGIGSWTGFLRGEIVEEGPLRVKLRYKSTTNEKEMIELEFYKDAPYVKCKGSKLVFNIDLFTGESPTSLSFISSEKEENYLMDHSAYDYSGALKTLKLENISSDWINFQGNKGSIGFIFNRSKVSIGINQNYNGQFITFSPKQPDKIIEVIICLNSQTSNYAKRFASSVKFIVMNLQNKSDFLVEKVPDPEKDFPIMHSPCNSAGFLSLLSPEQIIKEIKTLGSNWIVNFYGEINEQEKYVVSRLPDVVNTAHKYKLGVNLYPSSPRYKIKEIDSHCLGDDRYRELYLGPLIENFIKCGVDAISLADEASIDGKCQICKNKFKEKYGYEPPESPDFKNLTDPKVFDLLKFKIETYTHFVNWGYKFAKRIKPEIPVYINQMPDQLPLGQFYPKAIIDFDGIANTGVEINIDPYFCDDARRQFAIKFQSASMHNKGSWTWTGDTISFSPELLKKQAYLNTFYGCKGIATFSFWGIKHRGEEMFEYVRDFSIQLKSLIGNLIMSSEQAKFCAIYWNKNAWLEYLKENNQEYDSEIVNYGNLKSLQWQYIFPKDINRINEYKILILPQDKFLPQNERDVFLKYVEDGGVLILSGNLINYADFRNVLGIQSFSLMSGFTVDSIYGPIPLGKGYKVNLESSKEAKILNVIKGTNNPIIFSVRKGKGYILYFGFDLSAAFVSQKVNNLFKYIISQYSSLITEIESGIQPILWEGKGFYLLGLYNYGSSKSGPVEVKLNEVAGNYRVFDTIECQELEVNGNSQVIEFKTSIKLGEIKFYQILPDNKVKIIPLKLKEHNYKILDIEKGKIKNLGVSAYLLKVIEEKKKGKITIGIVEGSIGGEGIMDSLKEFKDAYYSEKIKVDDLNLSVIANFDVLILPGNVKDMSRAPENWIGNLRKYVEEGGGILLCHDAVGGRLFPYRVFPEIATGEKMVGFEKQGLLSKVVISAEHPLTDKLDKKQFYTHPYWDHFVLNVGEKGLVILLDKDKNPGVVVGELGKGRVVCCGFLLGFDVVDGKHMEVPPKGWVSQFLINTLKWLSKK
ncbi:MAG TPA: hypothetical protein PLJ44_07135 [Victivallales bacterium]|nr:hypothetical protein [Victivallales bacterium]